MHAIEPLRIDTIDKVYNNIGREYHRFVSQDNDIIFCSLTNYLEDYLITGRHKDHLENIMSEIKDISLFDQKPIKEFIDFGANPETNFRLSILLPKLTRLRLQVFEKAYYVAQDIIEEKVTDFIAQEDLNLASGILYNNILDNFYVDLTSYLSDESLERFYAELDLLGLTSRILDGEVIDIKVVDSLDKRLDKTHKKELDYIKSRFIGRQLKIERGNNHD